MAKEKADSVKVKYVGNKGEVIVMPEMAGGKELIWQKGEVKTLPRCEWVDKMLASANFEEER